MASAYESNNTADRRFVRTAMKVALLDPVHEANLARRWRDQNDEVALHELTTAYMRLVIAMASKFRHYGLPMADLVSEGNVGLMQAAARFEPEREVRFSTYASWWIRSSIQDYVLRNWSIVRTGTTSAQKSLFFNLRRLRARIADTGDGIMTPENREWVATHLGVPVRDVEAMASRLSGSDRSLNAPLSIDGDGEWQDWLVDENDNQEVKLAQDQETKRRQALLEKALVTLNERERRILTERRLQEEPATLEDLSQKYGISRERVRQIEVRAFEKLQRAVKDGLEETGPGPR